MKMLLLIIILLCSLVGCKSLHQLTMEKKVTQGYSKEYSQGFADGSECGHVTGGRSDGLFGQGKWLKDQYKYRNSVEYKQGWDDGFEVGKGQETAWRRASGM